MQKKFTKRLTAAVLALALLLTLIPADITYAKGESWTKVDDNTYTLAGTDITAAFDGCCLYITGTGAIPDYDERSWTARPWNKSAITHLIIAETITSIGEFAFANLSCLEDVTMSSKTFLEDNNCFTGIAYEPVFHIKGYAETPRYYGTILYTSLDSIKRFAQTTYMRASFLFDKEYMVPLFQDSTNPTIANVYYNYDLTTPWEDLDEKANGNQYTDICRIISPTSDGDYSVTCSKQYVDPDYYELFSAVIGEDTLAATYVMEVERGDVLVRKTLNELFYELTIPEDCKLAGRTFRLISIDQGKVTIHEDLDFSDSTFTFTTDTPSTIYALVYH